MPVIEKILTLPHHLLNPWVYWIILLVSLLEPLPLLGSFVPGQTMVLLAGFMVKQGILDFGDLVFFAAAGAILGDLMGYLAGRSYGEALLTRYGKYVMLKQERFDKVKMLLHQYTGRTLVLGRFNSLTRSFSPFLAGSSGIPFLKFIVYNILGGFCWSLAFVSVGYVFGKSFEIASRFIGQFMAIALILSGIIIVLIKLRNKGKPIFNKKHRTVLIVNVVSTYLFAKMIEDVVDAETVTKWDSWISGYIPRLKGPFTDTIAIAVSNLFTPLHLGIASLAILLYLIHKRQGYKASLLFTGMAGGMLICNAVMDLVHRPRPALAPGMSSGYAFPSAQTAAATLFFCSLIFLFKENIKNPFPRFLFISGNLLLPVLVGFSGIYLNAHWLSDVLGGISLGLFWLTLLILFFRNFIPKFQENP
ncbi:MAG: Inner rane protein YabI [Fibrobacteres bacterium]|nr:Inner rane protein YabI [Fibrobacterota bacterium]